MISALADKDPALFSAFSEAHRKFEGESHFIRRSNHYPLCGRGDINTYAIFAENMRQIVKPKGRIGCIVPSGIATDDTTKVFFQNIVNSHSLISLYDFENADGLFVGAHRSYKFCLLTLQGDARPSYKDAEFAFFLHTVEELQNTDRRFALSAKELRLLNPNTRTCPIF